ncbi:MAG TPA: threonine--tRNA ligase [Desulfurococcales archaeon]|nr:threonine--tRNA ligase [Desulfurococcales archaeon]
MRILLIHAEEFSFRVRSKAIENPEELTSENREYSTSNALVVFTSVEEGDEANIDEVVGKAVNDIVSLIGKIKASEVILYPYAHLSSKLAPPHIALDVIRKLEKALLERGIRVKRAPFGWYKEFKLKCYGHPLSELSREIKVSKEVAKPLVKREKTYIILTPDGKEVKPEDYQFKSEEYEFKILVEKEALKKTLPGGEPKVIKYLSRYGFEWEPYSDYGHMRFGPEAALIMDLVIDYSWDVVRSLGIPVFYVKGTNMFNLSVKAVKEHADLYGDRLYTIKTDKGEMVLRYAACHQQFSMLKDWTISYRELPFGVFEIADSYRFEQSGEAELCFRLRRFYMPDLHIFVRDESEAKKMLIKIHDKIMEEMRKLGRNYELLVNVVNRRQYEKYKEFLINLARRVGKPILVSIYPEVEGASYYWTINIEYHILDTLNRPREIGTVQIDIGNARRFNITYIDENGEKRYPVILHSAIIGSIERYIYAVFDTAVKAELEGKKPMLPLWLSPVQVRVIPVTKDYIKYAIDIASKLTQNQIRVDVDDRDESLGKKIREAEKSWIPYIIVVGEKEVKENKLSIRCREENKILRMTLSEFVSLVKDKVKNYPYRPLSIPMLLSQRPTYKHL